MISKSVSCAGRQFEYFLPGVEDLQVRDADVVVAAVLLDVDGVLAPHPGPVLPVQPPEDGGELRLAGLLGQLAGELGLQGCQLVPHLGLEERGRF